MQRTVHIISLLLCMCLLTMQTKAEQTTWDTIPYIQSSSIKIATDSLGIWDFSVLSDSIYDEAIFASSSSVQSVQYAGNRIYYQWLGDSLGCMGFENNASMVRYSSPEYIVSLPLCVGDTLFSTIEATGEYCHLLPLTIMGTTFSIVEEHGTLKMPEATITNVYRVRTMRVFSEVINDTCYYKEEVVRWIHPRYVMPLVEKHDIYSYFPNDTLHNSLLYYYPITKEDHAAIDTISSDSLLNEKEDVDFIFTQATYLPNPVVNELQISYKLTQDANIHFSMHNSQGLLMYSSPQIYQSVGEYSWSIPMNGFPVGNYVLYIHADDMILSETIIKI